MNHDSTVSFFSKVTVTLSLLFFFFSVPCFVQAQTATHSLKINVFAVLSPEIEEQSEALGTLCLKYGMAAFPVSGYQIHCTLYMTDYASEKVEDLKSIINSLAFRLGRIPITTTGLHRTDNAWLFLNIDRTPALQALSDVVVKKMAPHRIPKSTPPDWIKDYPAKLENFMKYGSPNVFEGFEPHVTLLAKTDTDRLSEIEKAASLQPELTKPVKGFVSGIGMGIADRMGQMKDCILIQPFRR